MPLVTLLATCATVTAQGPIVTGVGVINRSMGGAGTAAPLDAIGAVHWNPGSISALPGNEVSFGAEMLYPNITLSSNIPALGPPGTTHSESGVAPIPSIGWVHHLEDSPFTIGLGLYGVGGFRLNEPRDPNHPLLRGTIQGLEPLGPLFADAEFLQIAPTLSYAVTDRLAIGVSPTIMMGKVTLDPLGPPITPGLTPASGNREHWGGGVQAGVYYVTETLWHLGFTFKSPQWFESFRFFTADGIQTFDLDYPMILSLGLAYSGFERWTFAADVRYIDFAGTPGYDQLGWRSVYATAVGAQFHVSDRLYLRCGYNYNQNPISSEMAFLNLSTPLIQQHNVATGFSFRLAENVDLSAAYVYLFHNSLTGPVPAPLLGPGTITNEIDAHSAIAGVTVRY